MLFLEFDLLLDLLLFIQDSVYLPSENVYPCLQVAVQPDRGLHLSLESAGGRGSRVQPKLGKPLAIDWFTHHSIRIKR